MKKISFRGRENTSATLKAVSSDGKYLPASMALIVWRVHPTALASSCWLISPWSNLRNTITSDTTDFPAFHDV